jgi:hypothetical protein
MEHTVIERQEGTRVLGMSGVYERLPLIIHCNEENPRKTKENNEPI